MKGGLQSSTNELARNLIRRGHSVSLLCALMSVGWIGWRGRFILKFFRQPAVLDKVMGYPIWRAWFPEQAVKFVVDKTMPDIIIVLARQPVKMALAARAPGIPLLMNLQDVEFHDHGGSFEDLGKVPCVANSDFTAATYHRAFGVTPTVIYPMIDKASYKTLSNRENVTFINPHPKKGLELAIAIARELPEIPFSFVEAWPLSDQERQSMNALLITSPNVTLHKPVSDMRPIYEKCAILLMPSKWEEAFGRVALEAQCSGIPVIASNRGGIPEAVGHGGVLLDPDGPVEDWVHAVKRLWYDDDYYEGTSTAALAHSNSPSFDIETQLSAWESIIKNTIVNNS